VVRTQTDRLTGSAGTDGEQTASTRILVRIIATTLPVFVLAFILIPTGFSPIFRIFDIPSRAMEPTLPTGSEVIVSRLPYGYSRYSFDWFELPISGRWPAPEIHRGDVAVFRLPRDLKTFYIKRVVGLPGDEVSMVKGQLVLNRTPVRREPSGTMPNPNLPYRGDSYIAPPAPMYLEHPPGAEPYQILETADGNGPLSNVGPYIVPAGNVFVLGDNRDNSTDSRVSAQQGGVGFVPIDLLIGKVVYKLPFPALPTTR